MADLAADRKGMTEQGACFLNTAVRDKLAYAAGAYCFSALHYGGQDLNAVAAKEVAQGIGRSHGVSAEGEVKAAGGSPAMAEIRKYLTGKLQWRQLTHFREIGNEGKLKPRFGKKPTFFRSVRKYRRAFPEKSRRRFAEAENSAA